jgi:serine/threonine protein kinase
MDDLRGRSVGQYEVLGEIGRGGMAVVYRAWQASLERQVALKVLPEYFLHDSEFLARFQREAKAAAALSHPNIVTIHDVGEQAGLHYIAMEYLEGGSLQDRLGRQPLALDETQRILAQIGSALDSAHSRGLIHRDIKPSNILFTADGRPKVADFGIARPSDEAQLTRTGVLMGTPEFMAPEQAEGRAVDHRADLYALGVVLYQMLTGRVPFRRTTPHATLHAVIYEPPLSPRKANPALSRRIEGVVLKALAKRPEERYQRGAEMSAALRAAAAGRPVAGVPPPPGPAAVPESRRKPLVWMLVAAVVVLAVFLGLLILLAGGSDPEEKKVAPVATEVAFETATVGVLPFSSTPSPVLTPAPATDTPGPTAPQASPTSTRLRATEAPVAPSETPLLSTDTPPPPTDVIPPPTRVPDPHFGRLAFRSNRHGNPEIYAVSLEGGNPSRLTNSSAVDWLPDWSPDGTAIAFTSSRRGSYDLWRMGANGGGQTALVTTEAWDDYARWAPDGRRLAFSSTALTQGVANSEIFLRKANGGLVQRTSSTAENQWPDWSPDGRIIFSEGFKGTSNWDIFVMDGDGSNRKLWLGGASCDVQASWSPDGEQIVFIRLGGDTNGNGLIDEEDAGDVWVRHASGGAPRQLTSGRWAINPAWSPDSKWLAFAQLRDSNGNGRSDGEDAADIWAVALSGGDPMSLVQSPDRDDGPSWTW